MCDFKLWVKYILKISYYKYVRKLFAKNLYPLIVNKISYNILIYQYIYIYIYIWFGIHIYNVNICII